jgi:hypothetical protein
VLTEKELALRFAQGEGLDSSTRAHVMHAATNMASIHAHARTHASCRRHRHGEEVGEEAETQNNGMRRTKAMSCTVTGGAVLSSALAAASKCFLTKALVASQTCFACAHQTPLPTLAVPVSLGTVTDDTVAAGAHKQECG